MKSRYLTALSAVLYTVCATAFFCLLGADLLIFKASHTVKFITCILVFLCGFSGSFILCAQYKELSKKLSIIRTTFAVLLIFYIAVIIDFTLLDGSFGRNISNFFALDLSQKRIYISENTNFIPFATVKLFIKGYLNGSLSLAAITENLFGNFFVFMPFALLIPTVIKPLNHTIYFTLSIVLFVILIELLQIFFLTGSADIDDLILNTLGALSAFLLLKTEKISRSLSAITYGVWN